MSRFLLKAKSIVVVSVVFLGTVLLQSCCTKVECDADATEEIKLFFDEGPLGFSIDSLNNMVIYVEDVESAKIVDSIVFGSFDSPFFSDKNRYISLNQFRLDREKRRSSMSYFNFIIAIPESFRDTISNIRAYSTSKNVECNSCVFKDGSVDITVIDSVGFNLSDTRIIQLARDTTHMHK